MHFGQISWIFQNLVLVLDLYSFFDFFFKDFKVYYHYEPALSLQPHLLELKEEDRKLDMIRPKF